MTRRFHPLVLILLALDTTGVILSGAAAFTLRYLVFASVPKRILYTPILLLFPLITVVTLACLAYFGGYRFPQRFALGETLGLALRVALTGAVATLGLIFLLQLGTIKSTLPFLTSRSVLFMIWSFTSTWLVAARVLFGRIVCWLFRQGIFRRRIAVVGTGTQADQIADRLRREIWLGYEMVGHLTTSEKTKLGALGNLDALPHLLKDLALDELWLALPDDDYQHTLHIVETCHGLPVTLRIAPRQFKDLVSRVRMAEATESLEIQENLLNLHRVVRRDLDLPVARVAFLGTRGIPATWGGVEKYVEKVSTHLAARGYRATVYCRPYYMTVQGTFQDVRLRPLPAIPTKHLDAIIHTALATAHVVLQDEDIIHYQAMGPSLLSFVPRLFGKRVVVTVQGFDWQFPKWGPIARRVLKLGEWASATFPHRTIAVSETVCRHYEKQYKCPAIFIPNGEDPPDPRSVQAIRQWGLEKDGYVLFVGRLSPVKGCHTLIEAFRQVDTDKKLVIAGGSSHSDAYVTQLQSMPGAECAVFTGYVYGDVLSELYSNAYLFVLPSEVEGRALVLLEALSYGNCVLVSDIPQNMEVVQEDAHTFHTNDVDDLTRQLQRLLDDPALVEATRRRVQARASARMNWEQVVDETEAVYHSLWPSRTRLK